MKPIDRIERWFVAALVAGTTWWFFGAMCSGNVKWYDVDSATLQRDRGRSK